MKNVSTLNVNNIEQSKNFENRILAVLPEFVESIEIEEAGMERASGYGQYNYFINGSINGEYFRFKKHHTSSQEWDWYQDVETGRTFSNWKKNLIVELLKNYFETV